MKISIKQLIKEELQRSHYAMDMFVLSKIAITDDHAGYKEFGRSNWTENGISQIFVANDGKKYKLSVEEVK